MGRKTVLFTASTQAHLCSFHLPYLKQFQENGWTVHAACGGGSKSLPYVDEVIHLPWKKSMFAPGNFRTAAFLRKKIRAEGYKLVSTHTSLAAFFTRLALWGLRERPPVVNMVHGYLFDRETNWLKRRVLLAAEQLTAPVTDLVLTMNQWDFETARAYQLGRRVEQIPGVGIDFSRFDGISSKSRRELREKYGLPQDSFVLIYAAEFSRRKSQAVLLRTMKRLPACFVLVLAGEGKLFSDCQALAAKLGISERVFFPGHVADLTEWYALSDAAVSASRSEGLPFHILEAMYTGLPLVSSCVKGSRDLISPEKTGLLYPYGDGKACADQILRLYNDAELRRRLTENARTYAAEYGLERVLPAIFAEYMTLAEK